MAVVMAMLINCSVSAQEYSRSKAAKYATEHATNYNPSFPKFSSDCTNFVSQCVNAGGIPMKSLTSVSYSDLGDVVKTMDYWASEKWTVSKYILGIKYQEKTDFVTTSTWSVVSKNTADSFWGFYNYMSKNGASCKEYPVETVTQLNTFIQACNVGDVLQVRKKTSVNKSHSVIVVEKSYDQRAKRWNMKIAYHTNDTEPVDFRTVSWRKFGTDRLWTKIDVSSVS